MKGEVPLHKGHNYQLEIQSFLSSIDIEFEGGSTNFYDFLKHGNNREDYDIKVILPNGRILRVECKFRSGSRICNKWFEEEFLHKKCDIIVINNPDVLSHRQRLLLRIRGITVQSTSGFKAYISRMKNSNTIRTGVINNSNTLAKYIKHCLYKLILPLFSDTRGSVLLTKFMDIPQTKPVHKYTSRLLGCWNCYNREVCKIWDRFHSLQVFKENFQASLIQLCSGMNSPSTGDNLISLRLEGWVNQLNEIEEKKMDECLAKMIKLQNSGDGLSYFDIPKHRHKKYSWRP
jgi:hypothetical protein